MQKLLPIALVVVVLAGCAGTAEEWGGYTEAEAKDVMMDPRVKEQIFQNAPGDPGTSPVERLYPGDETIEDADLRKVTVQGQEAWEYRDSENNFCVYVWEDPETETFSIQPGVCAAD